jgi:hypothetical protein
MPHSVESEPEYEHDTHPPHPHIHPPTLTHTHTQRQRERERDQGVSLFLFAILTVQQPFVTKHLTELVPRFAGGLVHAVSHIHTLWPHQKRDGPSAPHVLLPPRGAHPACPPRAPCILLPIDSNLPYEPDRSAFAPSGKNLTRVIFPLRRWACSCCSQLSHCWATSEKGRSICTPCSATTLRGPPSLPTRAPLRPTLGTPATPRPTRKPTRSSTPCKGTLPQALRMDSRLTRRLVNPSSGRTLTPVSSLGTSQAHPFRARV